MGAVIFLAIISVVGAFTYFSFVLPKIDTLADYDPPTNSLILSRDGVVLLEIGNERREIVAFEKIPKQVVNAFLAAEDDSFYQHHGVDYWGVLRAMLMNLKAGKVVQGGSTITQQVAKSLLLSKERSIARKIKDFLLALKIEEKFTKDEILFLYLNQVYLGGGYYGIKTAAKGYYNKELNEVTNAEAAMLAGLLVAPGKYSPYLNPEYATKRQHYVLGRLYETKKITKEEYEKSLKERIKFKIRKKNEFKAGYFTDWVRQRLIESFTEEKLIHNGFKIVTTIDFDLQARAEKAVLKGVREVDKRQGYLGPIGNLKEVQEMDNFDLKIRKEILEEKSTYFYLADRGERTNEYPFSSEFFTKMKASYLEFNSLHPEAILGLGIQEGDDLYKNLQEDNLYKAYVTKVDDENKLIHISLGGTAALISQDYFKWLREREVSENREFYANQNKPSLFVKRGDLVWVTLVERDVPLSKILQPGAIKRIESSKYYPTIKNQKYLLCSLEQNSEVQGALISLSPDSGEIISFVGGNDFSVSQFNRAIQSLRQPGSAVKPFIYAAGLENGYNAASIILDSPEALSGGNENDVNWKPKNYDGKYLGPITFRHSLEQSRNIPTIKLAEDIGVRKIMNILPRFGLEVVAEENLSVALGNVGVNLIDLVSAYAIFPNGGRLVEPVSILSITDKSGVAFQLDEKKKEKQLIEKGIIKTTPNSDTSPSEDSTKLDFFANLRGRQVYDPRLSFVMTNILKGVIANGTGRPARALGNNIAGKTGTTSSYVDAWFVGYSSRLATGVWVGMDNNKTMGYGETGTKSALPIWIDFMADGLKKHREGEFFQPNGIINMYVNKETGKPVNMNNPNAILESFVEGTEPGSEKSQTVTQPDKKGQLFEEEELYD